MTSLLFAPNSRRPPNIQKTKELLPILFEKLKKKLFLYGDKEII